MFPFSSDSAYDSVIDDTLYKLDTCHDTLYKLDTSLRWTVRAGPNGDHLTPQMWIFTWTEPNPFN